MIYWNGVAHLQFGFFLQKFWFLYKKNILKFFSLFHLFRNSTRSLLDISQLISRFAARLHTLHVKYDVIFNVYNVINKSTDAHGSPYLNCRLGQTYIIGDKAFSLAITEVGGWAE